MQILFDFNLKVLDLILTLKPILTQFLQKPTPRINLKLKVQAWQFLKTQFTCKQSPKVFPQNYAMI